jgi:hypothetical protein
MQRKESSSAARSFRKRWALVNEFERRETQRTPLTEKYRQFLALMELGRTLKWSKRMDQEIGEVRNRWRRLWEYYRGQAEA